MLMEVVAVSRVGFKWNIEFGVWAPVLGAGADLTDALVMEHRLLKYFGHEFHFISKL